MQNLISSITKFVSLTNDDIELLSQLFVKNELNKNEYFLKQGTICNDFAFVSKGLLRHYINSDAEEETYYFSAENDFACDYESFISRMASKKTIIALEYSIIYTISYTDMQIFYQKVSTGERFGRLFLESRFSKAINHIISSHTDSAEQRYLNFLSAYRHIEQRIPQYYIASFVGITPQSLSRIRKKMSRK